MKFNLSSQQATVEQLAAFVSSGQLFDAYVALIEEMDTTRKALAQLYEERYTGRLRAAAALHESDCAAARADYLVAVQPRLQAEQARRQQLRDQLNERLNVANKALYAAEDAVCKGGDQAFASVERRHQARLIAARELAYEPLGALSSAIYRREREALTTSRFEAMSPARSVYDSAVEEAHRLFNAELKVVNDASAAFAAPFAAARQNLLERAHDSLCRSNGLALVERDRDLEQLRTVFDQLETKRRQALVAYFGDQCERRLHLEFSLIAGLLEEERQKMLPAAA